VSLRGWHPTNDATSTETSRFAGENALGGRLPIMVKGRSQEKTAPNASDHGLDAGCLALAGLGLELADGVVGAFWGRQVTSLCLAVTWRCRCGAEASTGASWLSATKPADMGL
jgi:hypothetical protein